MKKAYIILGAIAAFGSANAAQNCYGDGYYSEQSYYQGQPYYQSQPYYQGQTYYYDQGSPSYYNEGRSYRGYSDRIPQPNVYIDIDSQRDVRFQRDDLNRGYDQDRRTWGRFSDRTPMPAGSDLDNRALRNESNIKDRNLKEDSNRSWFNRSPSNTTDDSYRRHSSDNYYSEDTRRDQYADDRFNRPAAPSTMYSRDADQYNRPQGNDQFATEEDRRLGQRIREELRGGWFSRGYDGVILIIRDRNVTLRGNIENPSDKQKLEDKVRNIEGVRSVNTQLTMGPRREVSDYNTQNPNATTTYSARDMKDASANDQFLTDEDRQLGRRLREELRDRWFSRGGFENVSFIIRNGNVTLVGHVESQADRSKVEDKVKSVSGIKNVSNQLGVRGSERTGSRY